MDSTFVLLLLLSLTITSPVESQILPIFKCSSVLQTASCNELSEEVIRYGCNNDTQCMQCSAQCDFIYPNGTRCPSNDCTIGLCSAYVSLTHYAPTASCIESYGSDYCSFCELCAPSVFDSGSNNGTGIIDALCESNYLHLFCRILPQGADCINGFGNTVCSYCEATQTLCSPLSLNNLTPTQEDTLCTNHASLCALYNNELFCNLSANATLCAYCQYTLNNSICLPSPNCSTSNALVCRLLNSDDGCVDRYSSDFCFECLANYSACDVINRGGLSASQRASLCESETASSCQTALMQTNCSSVYSSYTCDYCDATQDTCRYIVDFGNSTIACNSEEIAMCAIDYGFFPCFLLNSTSYCSDCGNSLSACQYIYDPELIPPVCDRQSFLSLCSYFLTTVASFSLQCPQVFSNYTCSICQYSPIRCFDRGNSADGQALLCSNDSIAVCTDVVYPNGSCLRNDSEIDCDFCLLQHLTCDGINGTNNGSTMTGGNGLLTCETFEALYCQLIASDLSSCHLKYEDIVCNECVQYVTQCGSLNANNLTQDQLNILCIQKQVPYCELAIITNSSSFCGDDLDCSYCFATEGICHSFSNETLKICSNTSIVGDCNDYLYYPCYSFNEPDLCNTCKSIIMACPNIVYNPSYVPQSICTNTEYLSFCSQIIQQDCQQIYGYHACNYCQNINVTCPSVSSSSILSSFNQFCLNDADKCNQLLSSVPYSQCNATYTDLDCSFCSLLQLYCNESNNDIPCTKEFIFFCSAAYNDVNCSTTYSADTCQNCKNYLKRCPTIENGNLAQFCVSDASISTCGAYPYGVGCRPYFQSIDPDLMIICDFCSFYGTSCHDIICNEEDRIVQQCSSIITYGVSPTFIFNVATLNVSNDTAQCLPCSAAYAICLIGNVTINGTSIIDTSGSGDSGETEISLSSINIGSTTQYVLSSISSSDAIVTSFTIPDISSAYINTVLLNVTSTVTDITTPVVITSTIINTAITNSTFGISSTVVTTIVDASSTIDITSTVDVTFTTDISSLSFSKVDYFVTLTPTISTIIASSSVSYSAEITSHSLTTARISTTSTFPVTTSPFDTIASSTALSTTSTPAQTTSSTSISTISYTSTTQTAETTPTSTPAQTTSSTSISTISYTSTTQTAETTPTSGAPLPTETPTVPTTSLINVNSLSTEEKQNALTLRFSGLTIRMFLSKVSDFLQAIASLVNKMLSTTRKRQQMITSDGVLIIDGSLQTLSNGQIEVAFIARDTSGNVVMGSTVKQAITANETNLIQAVGATSIGSITEGVPEHLTPTPSVVSNGLSDGAIAGIVIAVLIVIAIVLLVIAFIAYFYSKLGRNRGKYVFSSEAASRNLRSINEDIDVKEKERTDSVAMRHLSTSEGTASIQKKENKEEPAPKEKNSTSTDAAKQDVVTDPKEASMSEQKKEKVTKEKHSDDEEDTESDEERYVVYDL